MINSKMGQEHKIGSQVITAVQIHIAQKEKVNRIDLRNLVNVCHDSHCRVLMNPHAHPFRLSLDLSITTIRLPYFTLPSPIVQNNHPRMFAAVCAAQSTKRKKIKTEQKKGKKNLTRHLTAWPTRSHSPLLVARNSNLYRANANAACLLFIILQENNEWRRALNSNGDEIATDTKQKLESSEQMWRLKRVGQGTP